MDAGEQVEPWGTRKTRAGIFATVAVQEQFRNFKKDIRNFISNILWWIEMCSL